VVLALLLLLLPLPPLLRAHRCHCHLQGRRPPARLLLPLRLPRSWLPRP
jgi:hypothetical protein